MTQPNHVPDILIDKVRPQERMPVPDSWVANRPGEITENGHPRRPTFGSPGPDQGYGLKLARRFIDDLQLAEGENPEDVVAGCLAVGLKRASMFGRAPVIYDMELAFILWGFLGGAPQELIDFRVPLFQGAAQHYWEQRAIVDQVPPETLKLTPDEARLRLEYWRTLLN